ncbi:MAG: 4-hydroxy-tetrahydrodipicolinate synthase, partial [bacterium]|nr:4-hydroxy-tetrahydrodipicolinate synthase [bacterium]
MNPKKYSGAWTALITPFKTDGSLDEAALRKLVRMQIEGGITGIVPVGTTGESPTTTADEDRKIIEIAVEESAGRVPVMAGTGSNNTHEAILYTEAAKKAGADACLVVTPYYNKPTPDGLKQHYAAVADIGLPVIVYNIKGRTGINIDTDTLMEIAQHPMIVGVKEASGDI